MNGPTLKFHAQQESSKLYGYDMDHSEDVTKRALEIGHSLVNQAALHEADLKKWASETVKATTALAEDYEKISPKKIAGPDRRIWEIAHWETEISRVTRVFFNDFSSLVEDLKKLNPPLTSSQIDPFITKILTSRRQAIEALTPMAQVIDRLTRLKTQLAVEPSSLPLFRASL